MVIMEILYTRKYNINTKPHLYMLTDVVFCITIGHKATNNSGKSPNKFTKQHTKPQFHAYTVRRKTDYAE